MTNKCRWNNEVKNSLFYNYYHRFRQESTTDAKTWMKGTGCFMWTYTDSKYLQRYLQITKEKKIT